MPKHGVMRQACGVNTLISNVEIGIIFADSIVVSIPPARSTQTAPVIKSILGLSARHFHKPELFSVSRGAKEPRGSTNMVIVSAILLALYLAEF